MRPDQSNTRGLELPTNLDPTACCIADIYAASPLVTSLSVTNAADGITHTPVEMTTVKDGGSGNDTRR